MSFGARGPSADQRITLFICQDPVCRPWRLCRVKVVSTMRCTVTPHSSALAGVVSEGLLTGPAASPILAVALSGATVARMLDRPPWHPGTLIPVSFFPVNQACTLLQQVLAIRQAKR